MPTSLPAFLLLLTGALAAQAAPLTITSSTNVVLDFNGFSGNSSGIINGLSGQVQLSGFAFTNTTVDSQAATKVTFNYMVTNDAGAPVLSSRISNFAFNTSPTVRATTLNQVTGVYDTVVRNANQPNGIGTVEVCFTDVSCPGGGSGGVAQGQSRGGTATLYFAGSGRTSFVLDNAYVRYQSILIDCDGCWEECVTSASGAWVDSSVPEPSTYAMFLAGGAALAIARRKAA